MIEVGDMVHCTGQLTMTKHTAGVPEDIDRMGSPRSGQEVFEDTTDAPEGTWVVRAFCGRFASLMGIDKVTAWPTDQLMKVEK